MRDRWLIIWLAVGWVGLLVAPWYGIEEGFFSTEWLPYYPFDPEVAPAALQVFDGKPWLAPLVLPLLAAIGTVGAGGVPRLKAKLLVASGASGLAYLILQGFGIGALGPNWSWLAIDGRQFGLGWGGLLYAASCLMLLTRGLAAAGAARGDAFISGALGVVVASITTFVFLPVGTILVRAFEADDGTFAWRVLSTNLLSAKVWGASGVAWNSILLATLTGLGTTTLGLAFALVATRTTFRAKRLLRALTVLPIITPPFVIGLALILVFGRAGAVTLLVEQTFGVEPSRYIFGLPGILLAQLLAFTPIAFLVLIGVVEGVSPSLEEASTTLGASPLKTFTSVSLPLMRPGLANAFLLGFIESLADFGNPIVLGGSFDVLSTEIYFAVAGAQGDVARAAALAIVLLGFTLSAFLLQRLWLGKKTYTSMTGKADSSPNAALPPWLETTTKLIAVPWAIFTAAVYVVVLAGGFVENLGRNNTFTLAHYARMFDPDAGAAWSSLWTTIQVAAISAPLTAALGLTTAYLLARHEFRGHGAFEFGTMLSFAIPGTVIGVSYILAFNVPPIEMTSTGIILVACFVFRNMPVGIRAGLASLTQIDKSLDEASITLGASAFTTARRVVFPLLRPAVVAALVYGFVRAMTAVSAVIFLVSADYELATTYILGRVEEGEYGPAIAYSSVLIVFMLVVIASIQRVVGQRDIGRQKAP